jgi:hypothetical protein
MASTLSVSTGFNEENFLKKLDNVTPTQDSIQSLALWIIHHKINHEAICRLWLKKLNDGNFLFIFIIHLSYYLHIADFIIHFRLIQRQNGNSACLIYRRAQMI